LSAKKLTDKQIKQIVAERAEGKSYSFIAKKYSVSPNTIKNYCQANKEFAEICNIKKAENAKNVLEHMENKAELVCDIMDKCLTELADPDRLSDSSTREIAVALGIIIDKFTQVGKNDEIKKLDEVLGKIEGNI